MAVMIGGLTQQEALTQLGVSRQTLYRYRQRKDWPGDDADWAMIAAYVGVKRGTGGRKSKKTAAPAMTDDESDDVMGQLREMMDLDDELKRTLIEKHKTQIADYQKKVLAEYRDGVVDTMNKALDRLFDAIEDCELTEEQLERVRATIRAVKKDIGNDNDQMELAL